MDVEEDTVSLGDEEEQPFVYEDFADSEFDDIDEMVLDCYNVVSMNLGTEASLFRQVPPARALTHTDTLPLHVRYMPALYIVSKPLICHVVYRVQHITIFVRMRSMMRAVQTVREKWLMAVRYPAFSGY